MLSYLHRCALFLIVTFLSACTGIDRVMMSSDPSASVRYMKENQLTYADMGPEHQIRVCEGYLSIKRFHDFDQCMESYRERIPAPAITVWLAGPGNKQVYVNDDYAIAYEYGMRAQAALDLGDYFLAKQYGIKAYQAASRKPSIYANGDYWEVYRTFLLPRAAGVLAIIAAIEDNKKLALEYIRIIEAEDTSSFVTSNMEPIKLTILGRAYLAINEPEKAYATLTETNLSEGRLLMTSLHYVNYINPAYYAAKALSGFDLYDAKAAYELENSAMICRSIFAMKKNDDALGCYKRLADSPILVSYGNLQFLVLHDLGTIELVNKNWQAAIKHFEKAIELLETQRSSITLDGHKMGFVSERMSVYGKMIEAQLAIKNTEKAFEYVERSKSRALVDLLASKKQFGKQVQSGNQQIIQQIDESSDNAIAATSLEGTRNIRGLKRKLAKQSPKLSSVTAVSAKSFMELVAHLPDNETLIEYYGTGNNWYAFVIENKTATAIAIDAKQIHGTVETFRKQILNPTSSGYIATSLVLYRQLFEPLEKHITNKQLTIVAHGPLHYLPFGALYDGNQFLIDRYSSRLLPSASVLPLLNSASSAKSIINMLVFGNPDLGDVKFDLPGAQKEAEALAKSIANSKVLLRKQATETAMKSIATQANTIHIASHGEFDSQQPLNSRLLLAADETNDGFLTVNDIYNLDLTADLVTLSACETGIGDIQKGDDVIGLSRGFLYAGAHSIVSSLWVVDDEATEKLMVRFYSDIEQFGKRESLRQSQLHIKNTFQTHPFYWAAFQLTGGT